jgi:hypothetical protein
MAHVSRGKAMAKACRALMEAGYARDFGEALRRITVWPDRYKGEWAAGQKPGTWADEEGEVTL